MKSSPFTIVNQLIENKINIFCAFAINQVHIGSKSLYISSWAFIKMLLLRYISFFFIKMIYIFTYIYTTTLCAHNVFFPFFSWFSVLVRVATHFSSWNYNYPGTVLRNKNVFTFSISYCACVVVVIVNNLELIAIPCRADVCNSNLLYHTRNGVRIDVL